MSMSKQTDNHFFASVMNSKKELIPVYHDVVLWLLKRDLLITLHLRIRVVATRELKIRVKTARDMKLGLKNGVLRRRSTAEEYTFDEEYPSTASERQTSFFLKSSSKAAQNFARRMSSSHSRQSEISELNFNEYAVDDDSDSHNDSEPDAEDSGWDTSEDPLCPSMIPEPGKAKPTQRRWLSAMSEGKDPVIARRFDACVVTETYKYVYWTNAYSQQNQSVL